MASHKLVSTFCGEFVCWLQCAYCGFLLQVSYLSVLVLSKVRGFNEALSYFRRQQIVLSEEMKWHNLGWDFFEPENLENIFI